MLLHFEIKTGGGIYTLSYRATCYINVVTNPVFRPASLRWAPLPLKICNFLKICASYYHPTAITIFFFIQNFLVFIALLLYTISAVWSSHMKIFSFSISRVSLLKSLFSVPAATGSPGSFLEMQNLRLTSHLRICILTTSPGDSYAHYIFACVRII